MNKNSEKESVFVKEAIINNEPKILYMLKYQALLDLSRSDTVETLEELILLAAKSETKKEIDILLSCLDWRAHVIGLVLALLENYEKIPSLLWNAFDNGSWAAPQLAACLYLKDENFLNNAVDRVNSTLNEDGNCSRNISSKGLAALLQLVLQEGNNFEEKEKYIDVFSKLDQQSKYTAELAEKWQHDIKILLKDMKINIHVVR